MARIPSMPKRGKPEKIYEYTGPRRNGKPHGRGNLKTNTYHYKGPFKDGVKQGRNGLLEMEHCTYKGNFKDGRAHGQGVLNYKNKNHWAKKYYGKFEHGHFKEGVLVERSGLTFEGPFQNNKPHGRMKVFQKNGALSIGYYRAGKFFGTTDACETRRGKRVLTCQVNGCALPDSIREYGLRPCGHVFCKECYENALRYDKRCPCCRDDKTGWLKVLGV